ncbi:MAG TPA: hypothetical protein VL475_08430 [Planctomycetaceae bacterium]|nr:hypothetical protein [Planctomycetaceae bacterium]
MSFMAGEAELQARIGKYAETNGIEMTDRLGGGVQGVVYQTTVASAIKAFNRAEHYEREVAVYRRLRARSVTNVCGFSVPRPIRYDDELLILEMTIVQPPFVLDFASAGLDGPLYDHTPEAIEEWIESRKELFEDNWPIVRRIISEFKSHGIFLSDVKPGNIMFE